MTKTEFALLVDEMLNEYGCFLTGIVYYDGANDGICKVTFNDGVFDRYFFEAYRLTNRAKLKLKLLFNSDLLISVDPEYDLGF